MITFNFKTSFNYPKNGMVKLNRNIIFVFQNSKVVWVSGNFPETDFEIEVTNVEKL